jgi:uncharacterized membrane protein YcaP (DUF421 family)
MNQTNMQELTTMQVIGLIIIGKIVIQDIIAEGVKMGMRDKIEWQIVPIAICGLLLVYFG